VPGWQLIMQLVPFHVCPSGHEIDGASSVPQDKMKAMQKAIAVAGRANLSLLMCLLI
jgi:hypothetical protein